MKAWAAALFAKLRGFRGDGRAPVEDRAALGRWGEDLAARELRRRGYAVLERNQRVGRGEVDLVARQGETVVLVEVKTRRTGAFGEAREAISTTEARRLVALGRRYAQTADATDWRIDVVAIDVAPDGGHTVEVIENAVGD
ncbi:MAG: YraN family protein [Chloroflexota bacterium]|nr:YraN family protein [Chloroflexota bacterium]